MKIVAKYLLLPRQPFINCILYRHNFIRSEIKSKSLDVAVIGAPNAGKSLLTNQLIKAAVCAVSSKMDTTLQNTDCILTEDDVQLCVVDSPGTVGLKHATSTMGRSKDDSILSDPEKALSRAEHILVVQDVTQTGDYIHHRVLHLLHRHSHLPSSLVLNKVDLIRDRKQLLELTRILCNGQVAGKPIQTTQSTIGRFGTATADMKLHSDLTSMGDERWQTKYKEIIAQPPSRVPYNETKQLFMQIRGWSNFGAIFFVSSLTGEGIDHLRNHLKSLSEEKFWKHDPGTVTNKPPQQICINSVRAALLDTTPANVAYTLKPKIVDWNEEGEDIYIAAEINCEKDRIARLIIGKEGQRIAEITDRVKAHMHTLFQRELVLRINVKSVVTFVHPEMKNISNARLLSLKYCSHLDNCNFFGNCMTYGTQEEAFCSCIAANLDHKCAGWMSNSSLPTPNPLTSSRTFDFSLMVLTVILLSVTIFCLFYFASHRWKEARRKRSEYIVHSIE